ncbi:MAG: MBL fold metallo-hydrolase [Ruminococcaceae bacterium]|nr:MBL fold metallo-hydrolase [Oscillospiraceae bacterium]
MDRIKITDVRVNPGDSGFLIDDGKTAILYDTGFGFTGFAMAEKIKQVLGDRRLDYIFLTHSHYDHALGSAYILRHYSDAKVVAGRYAAEIFKRQGAIAVMQDLDRKCAQRCGVEYGEFLGNELRVDITADDGDIIEAGDMCFRVLYLPGHTRCSIGYYCEEHALMLSSETIGVYDGEKLIVPSFLVSYNDSLRSIDKVLSLKIENLLAPHLGLLSKEQTMFFLSSCKQSAKSAAGSIADMIKSGTNDNDIIREFKNTYWRGYIKDIYPEDAIDLNTSIMITLIRKELA